jgi:hypothetical protein
VITSTPVVQNIWVKAPLQQVYPNGTLPTEAANGGNAKIALSFSDFTYASDSPGAATTLSGLYTSGAVTSRAKSGITVTNNSTSPIRCRSARG